MNWRQRALDLVRRFGPTAKFAAKAVVSAFVPGGAAIVELIGDAFDVAEKAADLEKDDDLARQLKASADDLERLGDVLGLLAGELGDLTDRLVDLEGMPDRVEKLIARQLADSETVRNAAAKLEAIAGRFDRLEAQNRELLHKQGYATGLIVEMLPLLQRAAGVADFVDELRADGVKSREAFARELAAFQAGVGALIAGEVQRAVEQLRAVSASHAESAAARVAEAAAESVASQFVDAQRALGVAVQLRPDDAGLRELHGRVTRATAVGHTPRPMGGGGAGRAVQVGDELDGWRLEAYLARRGPLTVEEAVPLFVRLAEGLAVAHERGIVHRDIKPANVLLRSEALSPVLIDFGLAADGDSTLTRTEWWYNRSGVGASRSVRVHTKRGAKP